MIDIINVFRLKINKNHIQLIDGFVLQEYVKIVCVLTKRIEENDP